MSQVNQTTSAHPSKAVAQSIAQICPDALFCGFKVKAKPDGSFAKIPFNKQGQGVAASTPKSDLIQSNELSEQPPGGEHWGVVMHQPIYDPFGELVLTILDLDTKRSTAPRDLRMEKLMTQAKTMGLLTERSHSKKGGHIIFLCKPDKDLPGKINLGNHQEVEIFGHPGSPGKSVMLTGDAMRGEVKEINCSLKEFLAQAGITVEQPKPAPAKPSPRQDIRTQLQVSDISKEMQRAREALDHIVLIDGDFYEWLDIGFALQEGFGDAGFSLWDDWSSRTYDYEGTEALRKRWDGFENTKGITLATLFHIAKKHHYKPPSRQDERRTAVEDFAQFIKPEPVATIDPETGEYQFTEPEMHWQEIDYSLTRLAPIRYLIDGFLAHSLFVMAGQPGVGKTSALIALAMIQAGFDIDGCELKTRKKRKTIFVTEDSDQIVRSLFAYGKHFGIDPAKIAQTIVIIDARRSDVKDLLKLAQNCEKHTMDGQRPWLVLDTANATLDLDDENDNAKVGQYLSSIKATLFVQMEVPICITAHTNKTISRQDSDATARGASAFTGDATLTGILFMDSDDQRYLKLTKTRYEPTFREIRFDSQTFTEAVTDADGDLQEIVCRVSIPHISSEEMRIKAAAERSEENAKAAIMDKCDEACSFIQSVINEHPEGVIIRKGSHVPKNPPEDMQGCYRLQWDDIYLHVPGGDKGGIRKAIGAAIFQRFAPDADNNCWVKLG